MSTTSPLPPANPASRCRYCAVFSVGTPLADGLICVCDQPCGAARCAAAQHPSAALAARSTDRTATPDDPQADLNARWCPTSDAVELARLCLADTPRAGLALIPLCQPGKTPRFWNVDQRVVTVPGVVIMATDADAQIDARADGAAHGVLPYSHAHDIATQIARFWLRQVLSDAGTVAYALVQRGLDHIPVFEVEA